MSRRRKKVAEERRWFGTFVSILGQRWLDEKTNYLHCLNRIRLSRPWTGKPRVVFWHAAGWPTWRRTGPDMLWGGREPITGRGKGERERVETSEREITLLLDFHAIKTFFAQEPSVIITLPGGQSSKYALLCAGVQRNANYFIWRKVVRTLLSSFEPVMSLYLNLLQNGSDSQLKPYGWHYVSVPFFIQLNNR